MHTFPILISSKLQFARILFKGVCPKVTNSILRTVGILQKPDLKVQSEEQLNTQLILTV